MHNALFLADFDVIKPDPGLILWTSVIFLLVYYLLSKFAFRPIQQALKKRETDIQYALDEAKRAREEMANLKAANEELLKQAQEERAKILIEAKEARESILKEARNRAKEESQKIVAIAKEEIENMRKEAMIDLKNQVGIMAIDLAEKILREKLKESTEQEKLIANFINDMKLN
jgi:F-type H+-transporting ATPase subunit b